MDIYGEIWAADIQGSGITACESRNLTEGIHRRGSKGHFS